MSPYRAVLLALFVVGGALTAAAPAGAAVHDGAATPGVAAPTGDRDGTADARPSPAANNTTDNSSLGADISSFMQSSAAETDGAVETGMWTAAFDDTESQSVRTELVEKRTAELRRELAELRERRNELVAEREAGNVSENAYKAKIGRLIGEIDALQSAIDSTTTRAKEVNASVETLGGLQTEAQNLTGPEIATVAQNLTGVGNGEGGPPSHAGSGNDVGNGNGVGNGNSPAATNESANGTTPDSAGKGNGAVGAGSANGVANETGLEDAGNETGVDNGTAVAGPKNGTDNGVADDAANGNRGSSDDGGDGNAAVGLATTDPFDRVSTAFTASIGPFAPA